MEPIQNNSLTIHDVLDCDIHRYLCNHLSIDDILRLSEASRVENDRFYRFIENTVLTWNVNQDPIFVSPLFFKSYCPEYRVERFRACGRNGARYLKEKHQITSYFDRREIASGKSIEAVKNDLAQKQALLEEAKSSDPEIGMLKKVIVDCVFDGIITIDHASSLTKKQIAFIKQLYSEQYAARYQLTEDQVRHIIQKEFNPLRCEVIEQALEHQWIGVEHVVKLKESCIKAINTQRPCAFLYRHTVDKYPFLVTIKKYNLTQEQAAKLIHISLPQGSPLFCYSEMEAAVEKEMITLNQALEISHEHMPMLLGKSGRRLKKLIDKYALSQEQTFKIITYQARHMYREDVQWALDEKVLTRDQAIRLRGWQQCDRYLRELQTSIRQYNLTTEQVSTLLSVAAANQAIPFTEEIVQWGLAKNLLTIDQATGMTSLQELFLAGYKKFQSDIAQLHSKPNRQGKVALGIASNLMKKVFDSQIRMDTKNVHKLPFEFVTGDLMRIYSATSIDTLVTLFGWEHGVQTEGAVSKIFDELLQLSKQSI